MAVPMHALGQCELKRALTLLIRLTWVLNGVAREMLGHGEAGNRSVQLVLLLHGSPDLSPSAAADALGVSRSAVSHLLNRLEAEGLVDRQLDHTDHRAMKLRLTVCGLERVEAFENRLIGVLAEQAPHLRELATLLGVDPALPESEPVTGVQAASRLARAGAGFVADVGPLLLRYGVREVRDRFLLALLHDRGPLRPVDLAQDLEVTSGGVNAVIERLESAGLVGRVPSAHLGDRRAVLVDLTPRGLDASMVVLDVLERHARDLGEAVLTAARIAQPTPLAEVTSRLQLS